MELTTRRILLTQTAAAAALSGCRSAPAGEGVTVFDSVWRIVRDEYFDPKLDGLDWRAIRQAWRSKAAAAATRAELYLDVLFPVLDQFRTSHVVLTPPGDLRLSNGRTFRMPRQQKGRSFFMITPSDEAGMGAVLTWTGDAYLVEDVVRDGPAYAAGLRPGQLLQLSGLGGSDSRHELRLAGPAGERFTVRWSPGQAASRIETRPLDGGATYLRFDVFDRPSVAWAAGAFGQSAGPIVLDLRRNSGGLIREGWEFMSSLLPGGSDLGRFESRERDYPMQAGSQSGKFSRGLAVLIGPRTASCAEVTAAALQHHGRARLFGARTSGSVLASQIYDLPDGGKLMLPYADYLTPAGTRIEDRGVTPDVTVVSTAASVEARLDPAVNAALDWLGRSQ
jgi:carboxyl-terminal processing protease